MVREKLVKYEIELPAELDQSLHAHAIVAGMDVNLVIHQAIVQFIGERRSTGRLPDLPLEASEISAPVDLPRSASRRVAPLQNIKESRRIPDALNDAP